MLKQKPARLTYAQAKLITLIEERKLRRWCLDNGLIHSAIYRLAFGEKLPTYRIIASMCHLISPIEWLFYTDEKLPFEPSVLPKWTCENPSKYVKQHRYDYKTIALKYDLDRMNAYNTFVSYRASPTPAFIRRLSEEGINPTEFFTDGEAEIKSLKEYIPARGDIVSVEGKLLFVISKEESNKKHKTFSGSLVCAEDEYGIKLENSMTKGTVRTDMLQSFPITNNCIRTLIEKMPFDFTEKVLEKIREELS